jgi:hypothetical protein
MQRKRGLVRELVYWFIVFIIFCLFSYSCTQSLDLISKKSTGDNFLGIIMLVVSCFLMVIPVKNVIRKLKNS